MKLAIILTITLLSQSGYSGNSATTGKNSEACILATVVRDICSLYGSSEDSDKYKAMEDAITKDSGIINKASRYENSQQKIILNSELANSLEEYKLMTKKKFSKNEQCGHSKEVEIDHIIRDMWSAKVYSVGKLKVKQSKQDNEYYSACNIKYEAISRKDGPDGKVEEPMLRVGD